LQVGDTKPADLFYRDVLGFAISGTYPGASFYGSGGYHHQLAGNIWNGRRAGPRPDNMAGLEAIEIILHVAETSGPDRRRVEEAGVTITRHINGITLRNRWGTAITLNA
jgi:catechol 2,3-dioxygenase